MKSMAQRLEAVAAAPRRLVYTAQFGDYDPVMPVLQPDADCQYVVLSDRPLRVPRPWRLQRVDVPVSRLDDRLKNRWCKLHATQLFPGHSHSLYVDAHLQIIGSLEGLWKGFVRSRAPVGFMPHPLSHSVAEEVERGLRFGRIDPDQYQNLWPRQRARHLAAGFPDDLGVFFNAFFLRDHRHPTTQKLEQVWWEDLLAGLTRDQVALPFALWSTGTDPYRIPLDWTLSPYFRHWSHLPGTNRRGRVIRWFDSRQAVHPLYRWPIRLLRPISTLRTVSTRRRGRPRRGGTR